MYIFYISKLILLFNDLISNILNLHETRRTEHKIKNVQFVF